MKRLFVYACLLGGLIGSLGCGSTPVADDVGQREANEIVATLRQRGIDGVVVKTKGSRSHYSVTVDSKRFGEAVMILSRLGLPADKKTSFGEMTATSGIIPVSREVEALRIDRAVAAEVEQLIQARGDVRSVSVVVRYRAIEGQSAPSISIVAQRHKNGSLNEAELRSIATKAVPGVRSEDVFISLVEAPGSEDEVTARLGSSAAVTDLVPFLVFWRVPAAEHGNIAWLFVGLIVFSGGLAGIGGYIVGQFNWLNGQSAIRGVSDRTTREAVPDKRMKYEDESVDDGGEG